MLAATPLWVPLVVAGLGLLGTIAGTIGGVMIAQRRADRREDVNWQRERERERERWAREDAAQTFDHRRDAYIDFYESLRDMAFMAYNHGMGLRDEEELDFDWQLPTYQRLQHLRLYATQPVAEAAETAYNVAWYWGHNTTFGKDDPDFYKQQDEYNEAEADLLHWIRIDLRIPEEIDTGPGGEPNA